MRILVDLKSHVVGPTPLITQVEKVPSVGSDGATAINGKYIIPAPLGIDFRVGSSDYVLNPGGFVDGGDVASKGYAHLLASYPMFGHVYFNPLLTAQHVGELDLTAQFKDTSVLPPVYFPTRAQTGRAVPPNAGQMPTHTAVLPQNNEVSPARPGILISDLIDIAPYTGGVGTDEFLLFWQLYEFSVSDDVTAGYGLLATPSQQNQPAVRRVLETDQEPAGFSAYLTTNGGANWCEAGLLEPLAFALKTTEFRVAFKNTSASKVYIASFGVLF